MAVAAAPQGFHPGMPGMGAGPMGGRYPGPMGPGMFGMMGPGDDGFGQEAMMMDPNNPYMAQMMMARGMMGTCARTRPPRRGCC